MSDPTRPDQPHDQVVDGGHQDLDEDQAVDEDALADDELDAEAYIGEPLDPDVDEDVVGEEE
jgi:hypothetical protein